MVENGEGIDEGGVLCCHLKIKLRYSGLKLLTRVSNERVVAFIQCWAKSFERFGHFDSSSVTLFLKLSAQDASYVR